MQLQAMRPDMPDTFDAIVEISQSSDDVSILRAALLAAVDHQRDAAAEDLCACILAAGVLLAIECNATADYPLQIPDLSKFLDAWKERLSAIDDVPSVLDIEAGKGVGFCTRPNISSSVCLLPVFIVPKTTGRNIEHTVCQVIEVESDDFIKRVPVWPQYARCCQSVLCVCRWIAQPRRPCSAQPRIGRV